MLRTVGCLIVVVFFLAGCATTGNPRQGGHFGWSQEKAQMRIDDMQLRRTSEEEIAFQKQEESLRLEKKGKELKTEYTKQQQRIGRMKKKVSTAEQELNNSRLLSQTNKKEIDEAKQKLDKIKEELAEIVIVMEN